MPKITRFLKELQNHDIPCAVLSDPVSISYLTGYYADPHERHMYLFLFQDAEPFIFLPELDVARAKENLSFAVIGYQDSENPWEKLKTVLPKGHYDKVGLEFDQLNLTKYKGIESLFSGTFVDVTPSLNRLRLIKSSSELENMYFAGELADKALQIGFDAVSLGKTETDIIATIEYEMKRLGYAMSFETMVLTGNNAANPHGIPGNHLIEDNSLLLFDLGIAAKNYTSDVSRTVSVGEIDNFKRDIYNLCLEAQLTAINMIKPGVTASQIDAAARQVIENAGYGEYFNHRLGHGIGMSVHEFPSIMANNDLVIEEGMCFSVEPGIYIPGKVGVRIEDCGHVTKNGFKTFTKTSKQLLQL